MKSSKHVETCFVRANNDFDAKLTAFWMKKKIWTKIPKNGHCALCKHVFSTENNQKLAFSDPPSPHTSDYVIYEWSPTLQTVPVGV